MSNPSNRTLKMFAAITWYLGGGVLLLKGISMLREARSLDPGSAWPGAAVAAGALAGSVKIKYIFDKSRRKNLNRIDGLSEPKFWQFFRPVFL